MCVVRVWLPLITCPKAATAKSTPCDALWAGVCPRALPLGLRAQVCVVFVGVHRSVICIYDMYT